MINMGIIGGNMNNKLRKLLDVTLTEQQEREEARDARYCDVCNTELVDIEDKLCDGCTLKEQQLERDIDDELMEEQ